MKGCQWKWKVFCFEQPDLYAIGQTYRLSAKGEAGKKTGRGEWKKDLENNEKSIIDWLAEHDCEFRSWKGHKK